MAPILSERCGGNPFYINAVVQQASEQNKPMDSEEALNETLAVDLSTGLTWGELSDQVNRWIERINPSGITKSVLYLSALEKGDRLDLSRIQTEVRKRAFNEYRGFLAEVFMAQVLWAGRDKTLPGRYFHSPGDVSLPRFVYVRHRARLSSGRGKEIDVLVAGGGYQWVCRSRWTKGKRVGPKTLEALLTQAQQVYEDMDAIKVTPWIFASEGLSSDAEALAARKGVLWSNTDDFNGLLDFMGLRKLPKL